MNLENEKQWRRRLGRFLLLASGSTREAIGTSNESTVDAVSRSKTPRGDAVVRGHSDVAYRNRFASRLITACLLVLAVSLAGWKWFATESSVSAASTDTGATGVNTEGVNTEVALPVQTIRAGAVAPPSLRRSFAGTLIAALDSELAFERAGRLMEVLKREGDRVEQGELIARIDVSDLDATERRTRADLAAAEALLKERIAGPREQDIEVARARVGQWSAQWKLAQADQEREERLASRGAGSDKTLDSAIFNQQVIAQQLQAAEAELELLEEGTRQEQIESQQAIVDSIRGRLEEVEAARQDSIIVAPFDGVIARRSADPGTVIQAGTPIIHLISDQIEGQFGLPASVAAEVQLGDQVDVSVGQHSLPGTVDRLEPRVDQQTRTRAIYVAFDEQTFRGKRSDAPEITTMSAGGWVAGQVASVYLVAPAVQNLSDQSKSSAPDVGSDEVVPFWVPSSALARGGRGIWTLMVLPGEELVTEVQRRAVALLRTEGEFSLVEGMVRQGERLVVSGMHRITPGMMVQDLGQTRVAP